MVGGTIMKVHNVLRNYRVMLTKKGDELPKSPPRQLQRVDRVSLSKEALEILRATPQETQNDIVSDLLVSKPK